MQPFADAREMRGLCLDAAAARLNISPKYLRDLERGKRRLTIPMAERMSAVYCTSISDLIRPRVTPADL